MDKENKENIGNKRPLKDVSSSVVDEPRKKQVVSKTWEKGFASLAAFKQKHGHTSVPYRCADDPGLGTWVARQRKVKADLTQNQRARLEALGFQWLSTQDKVWLDKFERLKTFHKRHGHSCVPTSFLGGGLGEWTAKQRQKFTQGRLSSERQELLNGIGFVYRINKFIKRKSTEREDKRWWEQLERLIHFLLEHGHTLVPFAYVADPSLGRWVNEQRCQKMRDLLRQDRERTLSLIGFVWKVSSRKGHLPKPEDANAQFNCHFRELLEYKKDHGVFPTLKNHKGELGRWAGLQKQLMQTGKIEETRAQRFAAIGFCDAGEDQIWHANFGRLQSEGYNSIYTLKDPYLSHWVCCQTYLSKKGILSANRKLKFFDIPGFVWDSTPLNLPPPEPKHAMKDKVKKSAQKVRLEGPAATSSQLEENGSVETAKGNYVGLLAIASEWRGK